MTTSTEHDRTDEWRPARLKFAAPLRNERMSANSDHPDYIGLENIESWTGRVVEAESKAGDAADEGDIGLVSVFKKGDVLFGKLRPYLAKAFYAPRDGVCSTELLVMQPSECIHPRFLLYSLLTPDFVGGVDASTFGAKMPRASWDFIGSLDISFPPMEVQALIASYLDCETNRIDELMTEKERMLALLEEKRAALISHVVTRGLDPNAPLKPSGQEWLGEIPKHWEVTRFKYACELNPSIDFSELNESDEVTFLPMDRIKNGYFIENTEILSKYSSSYNPFAEGDIVIAKVTPCFENGNIAIATGLKNQYGFGSSEIFVIRPIAASQRFIFYYLQSNHFKQQGEASMTGAGGLKRVSPDFIRDHTIGLPTREEQSEIADFLDRRLAKSNLIAEEIAESIKLLKERRAALITATVTGQIPLEGMTK